jgi:TonB family protein
MKLFLFAVLLTGVSALSPLYGMDQPKAQVVFALRPMKPVEAIRLRLAGSGVFLLKVDIKTGKVTSVKVVKSTGHELLDHSAIQALQKWRYAPGAVREVRVPIRFPASAVGASF